MTTPAPSTLPRIATPLSAAQVMDRLRTASKRGRLPGFAEHAEGRNFTVAAHGRPFDGLLTGTHRDGRVEFTLRMLPKLPATFAAVLLLTIWPGVYFTDELIAQFLPSLWRPWVTYYWYLPLTVIPTPWIWRGLMRKSRVALDEGARSAIAKVASEVDGTLET